VFTVVFLVLLTGANCNKKSLPKFLYHIIKGAWNSLSDDVVCAPSMPVFQYRLKRFYEQRFYW